MKRRLATWLVRYAPLPLSLGAVGGVWVAFHHAGIEPSDGHDTQLLVAMGAAYALAALVMLVFNREWTLRALGQFWTYVADAALWGLVGLNRVGWRHKLTPGELLWIRAFFVVGVVCLVAGLVWYLGCRFWRWRRGRGKG